MIIMRSRKFLFEISNAPRLRCGSSGPPGGEVVIGCRNDSSPVPLQTLLWDYAGQRPRHVSSFFGG